MRTTAELCIDARRIALEQLDTETYHDYVDGLVEVLREKLGGQWDPKKMDNVLDGTWMDNTMTDGARLLVAAAGAELYLEQKGNK